MSNTPKHIPDACELEVATEDVIATPDQEPPVVARLVVEIRSDGSRTIARGALKDALRDEQVAVEATADSPLQLALGLARAMFTSRALNTKRTAWRNPRQLRRRAGNLLQLLRGK